MTRPFGATRQRGLGPKGTTSAPQIVTKIDKLLQEIRIWAVNNGQNPHSIAVGTGLSAGALRFLWKPQWNPNSETLRAIEMYIVRYEEEKKQVLTSPFLQPA